MSEELAPDKEKRLLLACRKGDHEAFRQIYDAYREKGFRLACRFLGNKEDALDALQDAFINAWDHLKDFEFRSSFGTWFYRITVNTCMDRRRSRKATADKAHFEEEVTESFVQDMRGRPPSPSEEVALKELAEALEASVEKLSEEHKTVFVLRVMEDRSYKEIAEVLDISEGTVMSRLFYARKQLKEMLEKYL